MNIWRPSLSQYSSALTYYIGQREKLCRALLWRDPRLNSQITIRIAGCEASSVHIFPTSEYFWKFSQKWCNLVEMWNVMIHNAHTHTPGRHENTWLNILPHIYLTRPSFMYYVFIPFLSPMVKFCFKRILVKTDFYFLNFWITYCIFWTKI